jgi:hypothetical protein
VIKKLSKKIYCSKTFFFPLVSFFMHQRHCSVKNCLTTQNVIKTENWKRKLNRRSVIEKHFHFYKTTIFPKLFIVEKCSNVNILLIFPGIYQTLVRSSRSIVLILRSLKLTVKKNKKNVMFTQIIVPKRVLQLKLGPYSNEI